MVFFTEQDLHTSKKTKKQKKTAIHDFYSAEFLIDDHTFTTYTAFDCRGW